MKKKSFIITFKSICAVIAGFFTIVTISFGIELLLEKLDIFPPNREEFITWMFVISIVYRIVISVLGGFVVGKLAPRKPKNHVIILAVIGTIIGIAGVITGWNLPGYPRWYAISLTLLTFPSIWYGGKLAISRTNPD